MKKQNKRSNIMITIVSIVMFLLGSLIFFYPTISNYFANKQYEKTINNYDKEYQEIKETDLSMEYEKALKYNQSLIGEQVYDPFMPGTGYALPDNYQEVLNISGNGVMGYIEIPKISLKIPIYHGSSEEVLSKGIGHLEHSALPIGGKGNNTILTGHRGLPRAELFTRLDEIQFGDIIYIHVLNDVLAYEVDNIITILPKDTSTLSAYKEKDMITLITCTPYGVNTHRLVVQGNRVSYVPQEKEEIQTTSVVKLNVNFLVRIIGIPIGLIIAFIIIFLFRRKGQIKKKVCMLFSKQRKNNIIDTQSKQGMEIDSTKKVISNKKISKSNNKKRNKHKKKRRKQRKRNINKNKRRGRKRVKKN